jgi:hypothetical protein
MKPSRDFDPDRFAAATQKLIKRFGHTKRFTDELAKLVFRYFGPPGFSIDDVAFRISGAVDGAVSADMFVLGGGLLTVAVSGDAVGTIFNPEIDELDVAPSWVTGGDRFVTQGGL